MEIVAQRSIRNLRLAWVIAAVLVLAFFCRTSDGYVLEGPKWPAGTVVFQSALGSAGRTLIDGNTSWDIAAAPAPQAWNAVMENLGLQANVVSTTASSGDGQNTIVFAATVFGDSFGNRTLAETVYFSSGSTMREADTVFNNHLTWNSYRGVLRYDGSGNAIPDIRRVLLHELGHAIGLDHPDTHGQHVQAIMNSIISDRETLSADDIAGAQHLYGARAQVSVKADFNADRRADYLLFNAATHQTAVWHLHGSVFLDGVFGPALPSGWILVCTADVNLDGKPDYVLFNVATRQTAVWYLDGTTFLRGAFCPALPAGWTLIAASDMDADGRPDYVLYNAATNQTAIWFLNGTTLSRGAFGPVIPAGSTLADANDFNDDGKSDFVLVNSATQQTTIWFMNGAAMSATANGPTLAAGWTLVGTADFNSDGNPDYLLFNPNTRQTAQWYLNGTNYVSGARAPVLPAGYSVIAR